MTACRSLTRLEVAVYSADYGVPLELKVENQVCTLFKGNFSHDGAALRWHARGCESAREGSLASTAELLACFAACLWVWLSHVSLPQAALSCMPCMAGCHTHIEGR